MARFDVRAEAGSMAAAFEARAHKQMYWVEVDAPSTDRGDDRGAPAFRVAADRIGGPRRRPGRARLRGPIGTGARRLARLIHDTSPQRANPHIVGAAPVCLLAHAQGATVYLDLSALPPLLSHYAARLLAPSSGLRVIFAALDERRALTHLDHLRDRVRTVQLTPLAQRRDEVPHLMQLHWATALRSSRRVDELGPAGLRALISHAWPRNLEELFAQSVRLHALLEHGSVRLAAAALGVTRQTLDDHLARLGFSMQNPGNE